MKSLKISQIQEQVINLIDSSLLDQKTFIEKLFVKASDSYIQSKPITELSQIATEALGVLKKSIEGPEKFILNYATDSVARIWVVQPDRSFIINTINEILKDYDANVIVLLHPIVSINSQLISCAYIEISLTEQLKEIVSEIEQSVNYLDVANQDYRKINQEALNLAKKLQTTYPDNNQLLEIAEFLNWLSDGGMIFLGQLSVNSATSSQDQGFGMLRTLIGSQIREELQVDLEQLKQDKAAILISKLPTRSPIQRRIQLTHVAIGLFDQQGKLFESSSFLGLFTAKALDQESSNVPIIRRKLQQILEQEEVYENSFDYKSIVNIIDSMPKDEVLKMDLVSLRETVRTILYIQDQNATKLTIRFDKQRRGVTVFVLIPRDNFNTKVRDSIQKYLENVFKNEPGSSEYQLDYNKGSHARLYFYLPIGKGINTDINLLEMEQHIADLARNWESDLEQQIYANYQGEIANNLLDLYSQAFPEEYQAVNSTSHALEDLKVFGQMTEASPFAVRLEREEEDRLVLYSLTGKISLSQALPVIENFGLIVISEQSAVIVPSGRPKVSIQRFSVKPKKAFPLENFEKYCANGLIKVFQKDDADDQLNSLTLFAGMEMGSIAVLRSYCDYVWQINKFAARSIIYNSLANESEISHILWQIFDCKFNPLLNLDKDQRLAKVEKLEIQLIDLLRKVKDITSDKILHSILDLLQNTLRTNYYLHLDTIALKINAQTTSIIPEPRPLYEVFVSAAHMQGIHLRSGKVSRGGIRWSDRHQDYRAEVLGLMRTQKIKNALIVPEGAKGVFIVKERNPDSKQALEDGQNAYRSYIRALLSITDNYLGSDLIPPQDVVCYDPPDPYLVVAADKGTAKFSDIANKIAVDEFQHWLGDAFASGGSQGYDHKAYGITAKGAWECVTRHFKDLAIDFENQPFTAVGIGDMAGDVFGNGLILSDQCKLIAAFNHKHIFIDPTPDPQISFLERKRLFELPTSQWSDYRADLLSHGGGIYERVDKEICLTSEARQALSISDQVPEVINGEQLVSHILKAKVDLLWNGGIGTYVKAVEESHSDVNDSANDHVRINAEELRARVVGEGGNLGFTQKARVEYAQHGGRGNSDAVDNSAGVDLSDHEVNLKILFAAAIRNKKLDLEARNKLLLEIAGAVTKQVLTHNRNQALIVTIGEKRSFLNRHYLASLIREVTRLGYVNLRLDVLPDEEDIQSRARHNIGLYRPELAVLLAASKLHIKNSVRKTRLINDPFLERLLFEYFPEQLRTKFATEIANHQLRKDIISTELTNTLIDAVGISFVHRMCIKHGVNITTVVKCSIAAIEILRDKELKEELSLFDTPTSSETFMQLGYQLGIAVRDLTSWLIRCHGNQKLSEILSLYQESYLNLVNNCEDLFSANVEDYAMKDSKLRNLSLSDFTVRSLLAFEFLIPTFEILWSTKESGQSSEKVAKIYFSVFQKLQVGSFLAAANKLITANKWEQELVTNSQDEILRCVSFISVKLINKNITLAKIEKQYSFQQYFHVLEELQLTTLGVASLAALARATRTLEAEIY